MYYINSETFEIYKSKADRRYTSPAFECDELITPIIVELNKKGYTTLFCCSGHLVNESFGGSVPMVLETSSAYISFDRTAFNVKKLQIPRGFEVDKEYDNFVIRKRYTQENRFREILETMLELETWVSYLKPIKKN